VLLGFVVGAILGLAAIFLLELLDRRVRSVDDLEANLEVPVLGTVREWRPSHLLGGPSRGVGALPSPV
jgi:capsular polysaccharide biosynthesis protein